MMGSRRVAVAASAGVLALVGGLLAGGGAALASSGQAYKVGNEIDGMLADNNAPDSMPPGIVNGPCTPSSQHPFPVVLVHGTFATEAFTWQALAPMLANDGYCVFGFNYGATAFTAQSGDHVYAIDYIEHSAAQLSAFVSQVLAWTTEPGGGNATQVDIVGHSQGGMMPRYYIEHGWQCGAGYVSINSQGETQCTEDDTSGTPGSSAVHMLVGLAPSNHGADAYGVVPLFESLFGANSWTFPEQAGCGACGEQEAGNPFLTALNARPSGGDQASASPSVLYYVIESADDEVVTPAPNEISALEHDWPSAFLHGPPDKVSNVLLQTQCATDATDHVGIVYDPVALYDATQALSDNDTTIESIVQPQCPLVVPPVVSG